MEIQFLGTGTGIPHRDRASPSIFLNLGETRILLDIGPGTLRQMARASIELNDIDIIFITHFHIDHIADLPSFLFASKYEENPRRKELLILGPKGLRSLYTNLVKLYGHQVSGGDYEIEIVELIPEAEFGKSWKVKAFKTYHREESIGFRFENEGKIFVYTGDTDYDSSLFTPLSSADLLAIECSLPYKSKGHLSPEWAGRIAQGAGVKRLALIHLYPIMDGREAKDRASLYYRGEVIVPNDLEVIRL
jgi:ribonuclease BN (tRNA processing enzyme)